MKQNLLYNSDIVFIVLIDEYNYNNFPFYPPDNLSAKALDMIKFFPKNLFQIFDSEMYLTTSLNTNHIFPYRVHFYKRTSKEEIDDFLVKNRNLKIVFLDENKDQSVIKFILDNNIGLTKIVDTSNNQQHSFTVEKSLEFITNNIIDICNELNVETSRSSYPSVKIDISIEKKFNYFLATRNNYLNYNNFIGNYFVDDIQIDEKLIDIETEKALKSPFSFNRQNLYLEQLKNFDELSDTYRYKQLKMPYLYDPLIVCLPFHNPDLLDFFPNPTKELKQNLALIRAEQTANYVNILENIENESPEGKAKILFSGNFMRKKAVFLDNVSFLTGSFKFCPYVRLPMIGKSCYKELSFLSPLFFNKFLTQKSQIKISDTIQKIGRVIADNSLSKELSKYLSKRSSQIVAISDLPIEWLSIDNIPLGFTHDITRIPETTGYNLLNSFMMNSQLEFVIDTNIIDRTLVIIGTNDPEFQKWHIPLKDLASKNGFKIEICLSNEDFKNAVNKFKPQFLIIDCHGGFDENTKETFLWIGKDKLTNEFITESKISIPLVFISACGTAPVYGTFNPIANAFMAMGTKSVTSTFLPVDINNSTMVYLTILNNLDLVSKEGSFNNWLEYISYNIRTAFIHRTFVPIDGSEHLANDTYTNLVQKTLLFKNRKSVYNEVLNIHKSFSRKRYNQIKPAAFEFLYYTNIGRGDLVLFKKNKEINGKINLT